MCDRNFLSTGFIFDDDAVSPWISCGRIPVGGRLLCPPYAFFALLGLMVGIFHPNNRSPLLTAGLVVFVEYCITSFQGLSASGQSAFYRPFPFSVRQKFTMQGLILGTICSGICSCCLLLSFGLQENLETGYRIGGVKGGNE